MVAVAIAPAFWSRRLWVCGGDSFPGRESAKLRSEELKDFTFFKASYCRYVWYSRRAMSKTSCALKLSVFVGHSKKCSSLSHRRWLGNLAHDRQLPSNDSVAPMLRRQKMPAR
jgi:hypothetical protein